MRHRTTAAKRLSLIASWATDKFRVGQKVHYRNSYYRIVRVEPFGELVIEDYNGNSPIRVRPDQVTTS